MAAPPCHAPTARGRRWATRRCARALPLAPLLLLALWLARGPPAGSASPPLAQVVLQEQPAQPEGPPDSDEPLASDEPPPDGDEQPAAAATDGEWPEEEAPEAPPPLGEHGAAAEDAEAAAAPPAWEGASAEAAAAPSAWEGAAAPAAAEPEVTAAPQGAGGGRRARRGPLRSAAKVLGAAARGVVAAGALRRS
ncbi:unnamed protein product [Prorocentrum cordatum]|uniref:Uncharacterized protein n=1 Tax=Prorocentrum cordatum TaxID=2364126 RepID=A0ABN9UFG9_9DINO|nr:unnamed protein product [Polarella glacialis]